MRYVKICPRCGRHNDELSDMCSADGEFLGMVPATPAPNEPPPLREASVPGEIRRVGKPGGRFTPGGPSAAVNTRSDQQRKKEAAEREATAAARAKNQAPEPKAASEPLQTLYLETVGAGRVFEVKEGYVVGQCHPSSSAQIQLGDMPGVEYVHRNHCSFAFKDGKWRVTAIDQAEYTNPTLVNQHRIEPGRSHPLSNGDRLTLSGVRLNVRIIEF